MRNGGWIVVVGLLIAVFGVSLMSVSAQATSGACGAGATFTVGAENYTLNSDGRDRSYRVYVPASYDGTEPVPLVIALHGGGGFAKNMARTTDFNVAADEHGFIVAYSNGVGNGWNDGRTAILQIAIRQRVEYIALSFVESADTVLAVRGSSTAARS